MTDPSSPSPASFTISEHVLDGQHIREYPRATVPTQEEVLQIAVKRYQPLDNPVPQPGDVTIIGAHANGFPKELYTPLWDDLLQETRQRGIRIRAIWAVDVAWQGQSGLTNQSKLGNDPGWFDFARDILALTNRFRHDMPRPIVAIGHSFGAIALANLGLMHPRLLSGLILMDPVLTRHAFAPVPRSLWPVTLSAVRRDTWPSRAAAEASFRRSSFYRAWDPRALAAWVHFGLRDLPDAANPSRVTLVTPKHHEVTTFSRPTWPAFDPLGQKLVRPDLAPDVGPLSRYPTIPFPVYRPECINTLDALPNLRPPTLFIFGGDSALSEPAIRQEMMSAGLGVGGSGGRTRDLVRQEVVPDCGHLVPLEAPGVCARHAAAWIDKAVGLWRREQEEYAAYVGGLSDKGSVGLDADWMKHLGVSDGSMRKLPEPKL